MAEETKNKAEYFVAVINEFGKNHHLNDMQSYRYLARFKGIDMIDRFYHVAHTQRFEDVIADLSNYCRRQGGAL